MIATLNLIENEIAEHSVLSKRRVTLIEQSQMFLIGFFLNQSLFVFIVNG